MDTRNILSKLLSLLKAKTKIGGLEVSDTDLRFAYFMDNSLVTLGLRLPPGIIEDGEIKNYDTLVEALKKLHEMIPSDFGGEKTVNAVVTLSSIHVYTQVFSLPLIRDENLKEAVQLNISMISPFDLSQAYASWQLVSQNEKDLKIEILSAFAQKAFIDRLKGALTETGFFAIAIESGTLSLTRLIRERGAGFSAEKPLLVLSVDDRGLRFLIIRLGQLHFEYFQSWNDIRGESKETSWEDFEDAIKRNLHQVLNFYGGHWQEPLTEVMIASNSLVEEISKVIKENFSMSVKELKFEQSLKREWYEVAGSAVRGEIPRFEDKDINLFEITVQEEFHHMEIMTFIKFWEALLYSSMGALLIFFLAVYVFLINVSKSIESQSSFKLSGQQNEEINTLETKIKDFNNSVILLSNVQKSLKSKTYILDKLTSLMNKNGITVDRLYFQAGGLPVIFSGETDSQEQILNFKNAIAGDLSFSSVNLNLSDIKQQEKVFSFTISFKVK